MEQKPMLRVENITKSYSGTVVLDGVTMEIATGEIHALIGENGAGKSTLCKMIAGAIEPTAGQILIQGKAYDRLSPKKAKEEGVTMVYQEFNLIPEMTIYENLFVGKEVKKGVFVDKKQMLRLSEEIFEEMDISIDCNAKIKDISVAYCQLVEIAKALLEESKLLILDEPTAPLTTKEIEILFQVLMKLKKKGISMIYISHRLEEIFRICDRITVLRDGKFITSMNTEDTNREELIRFMIGRELSQEFPKRVEQNTQNDREPILELKHVSNQKINNISFRLKKGEILGIAGLVGAGRTEVARAIFGADSISEGDIFIKGKKTKIKSPLDAIRNGIGLIPEDRKREGLMLQHSIEANISLVVIQSLSDALFINRKRERELLDREIEMLNIKLQSVKQPAESLSGGNQQKIVLAKWLATECDILIFDEPTRGIDVGAKKEIYEFLFDLKKQGKSIILISSEMSEILNLSDRILVMYEGRLTGEIDYKEATQEKVMSKASGL